jgi:undecaprenyl-diphosphatase
VGRVRIYVLAAAALGLAGLLAAVRVGEEAGALSGWQALALGITQGLTELLPISSSGHLILVPWFADWEFLRQNEGFNQTFDVALHLGTLTAVVIYFWSEVTRLLAAWFRSVRRRRVEHDDERIAWLIFVATIPAALAGALGAEVIANHLGEPWQIAILIAVFAILLWLADRLPARRAAADLRLRHGLLLGIAQSLALMPGVSRSGVTITAGRFLGLDRDSAARLSFLLLVPTVFGAAVWTGVKDVLLGELPAGWQGPFVIGMLAAAASGLLAIHLLLGYVRHHTYTVFVVYRLALALLILLLIASGVRSATF